MPDVDHPCPYETCDVPKGRCREGELSPEECKYWNEREENTSVDTTGVRDYVRWSGAGMGHRGVGTAAARSPSSLVGVVGPHDAGKTTLLGALWLLIQRGAALPNRKFAGSFTLGGWEDRAHFLRWPPAGSDQIMFPPHTSAGISREASLLHLALRGQAGMREIFVTDAPGEWFTRWATSAEAADAEGARWIVERSSGFLLVLDSKALAGENEKVSLGQSREQSLSLISRLGAAAASRPVAVVWSKADRLSDVSDAVRDTIQAALSDAFAESPLREFEVSVVGSGPQTLDKPSELLAWVLDRAAEPVRISEPSQAIGSDSSDPLLRLHSLAKP